MRRIPAVHAAAVLVSLLAGSAFAQAPPPRSSAAAARLEARVAVLEKRVAVLESNLATAGTGTPASAAPPAPAKGAPIVYFELAGADGQALKAFYSSVFAWDIDASATIAAASTGGVKGGIRQDPPEKIFYLGVPSIDEALKRIEAAGGKTLVRRTVIPNVVTFALFADPAGNRMGLAEFGSYK